MKFLATPLRVAFDLRTVDVTLRNLHAVLVSVKILSYERIPEDVNCNY